MRADTIESNNMKSVMPIAQSVMGQPTGAKGLFNSVRKLDISRNIANSNFNSTGSFKNSKHSSPNQRKNSLTAGDNQLYSQIGQLNQSSNDDELILYCDDSNRQQ